MVTVKIANIRRVNPITIISSVLQCLILQNLIVSRSSLLILIYRKAYFNSPVIATDSKWHHVSTFQSMFCNAKPTTKYSIKDEFVFVGLASASYSIWSLVVLADNFTSGLCGI